MLGKSKRGLTNEGSSHKSSEKIGGEIGSGKSGLFGADWGLARACRSLFGASRDQFLHTSQPRGKSRHCPERARFCPIGAFRSPRFAKPTLRFPWKSQTRARVSKEMPGKKDPKIAKEWKKRLQIPFCRHFGDLFPHVGPWVYFANCLPFSAFSPSFPSARTPAGSE